MLLPVRTVIAVVNMNSTENLVTDPEDEIKKLQELVKKLETQNQLLIMHRDPPSQPGNEDSDASLPQTNTRSEQPTQVLRQLNGIKSAHDAATTIFEKQIGDKSERLKADSSKLSLDCIGLIDVDRISLDADDSWLYKSPRHTPGCDTATKSPFLWVREEFDQSEDDISSFRRSLFYKLDEVSRNADYGNVFQGQKTDSKSEDSRMKLSLVDDVDVFTELTGVAPLGKTGKARSSAAGQRIEQLSGNDPNDRDTVTQELDPLIQSIVLAGKDRRVSESAVSDADYRTVNSAASEENLLGTRYRRADVTDIRLLAKMQEESLRMSYNVPLGSSKRLLSKSLNRSSGALVNSCDSLLADTALSKDSKGLNQSTGALLETTHFAVSDSRANRSAKPQLTNENRGVSKSATSLALPTSRNTAMRSGLPKATTSNSLPGTPYGSNQELSRQALSTMSNSAVPHRQSMPSLNRGLKLSVLKSHPSDSHLTSTGKKPLSLLRQPTSSTSSQATPVRGGRIVTPVKPRSTMTMTSGSRTANSSVTSRNAVMTPVTTTKGRPTTLSNSVTKPMRAITMGGKTPQGPTTPTSKSKPLAVSSKKPSTPSTPHISGIPKHGSLTKLSIPCKASVQTGHVAAAANDDDDWKEGCF